MSDLPGSMDGGGMKSAQSQPGCVPAATTSDAEPSGAWSVYDDEPRRLPDIDIRAKLRVLAGRLNDRDERFSCGILAGDAITAILTYAEQQATLRHEALTQAVILLGRCERRLEAVEGENRSGLRLNVSDFLRDDPARSGMTKETKVTDHPGTTPVRPEVSSDAGWRPIDSAPRDGTRVIMWGPSWDGPQTHEWATEARAEEELRHWLGPPTHWMPLPEPPK